MIYGLYIQNYASLSRFTLIFILIVVLIVVFGFRHFLPKVFETFLAGRVSQ